MNAGHFILFQQNGLIKTSYLDQSSYPKSFVYEGRVYKNTDSFGLLHHLLTPANDLAGFVLENAGGFEKKLSQLRFVAESSNCQWDDYSLTVFLNDMDRKHLIPDGSSIIGTGIFYDGISDIILRLDDANKMDQGSSQRRFWERIAFPIQTENIPDLKDNF